VWTSVAVGVRRGAEPSIIPHFKDEITLARGLFNIQDLFALTACMGLLHFVGEHLIDGVAFTAGYFNGLNALEGLMPGTMLGGVHGCLL